MDLDAFEADWQRQWLVERNDNHYNNGGQQQRHKYGV